MTAFAIRFIFAFITPPAIVYFLEFGSPFRISRMTPGYYLRWASAGLFTAGVWMIVPGPPGWVQGNLATAAVGFILWLWSGRKKIRSVLRAAGEKTMARLREVLRKMPRPRPVLQPVPQRS